MLYTVAEWADWRAQLVAGNAGAPPPEKGFKLATATGLVQPVKQEGDGDEVLEYLWTISTSSVDRDRDTIAQSGWELANYENNPVVLWAHRYGEPPIGRTTQLLRYPERLAARQRFPNPDVSPFADLIRGLVRDDFLRACSVGFRPMTYAYNQDRGGIDFYTQELLEWSICPIPSNPQALVEARAMGHNVGLLAQWCKDCLDQTEGEPGMWVPRRLAEIALRALEPTTTVSMPAVSVPGAAAPTSPSVQSVDPVAIATALAPTLIAALTPRLSVSSGPAAPGKLAQALTLLKAPDIDREAVTRLLEECMGCLMDASSGVIHAVDYLRGMLTLLTADGEDAGEDAPTEVIDLDVDEGRAASLHRLSSVQRQTLHDLLTLVFSTVPPVAEALPASASNDLPAPEGDTPADLLVLDLESLDEPLITLTDDDDEPALDLSGLSRDDIRAILRDAVSAGVASALTPYTGRLPD